MEKGTLATIITDVREDKNLPPEFSIPLATVRNRIKHDKLFTFHCVYTTPLLNMEQGFVSTIKKQMSQMCQIRQCLNPPQGIELVNIMIDGTEAQKKLIEFKKNSHTPTGESLL